MKHIYIYIYNEAFVVSKIIFFKFNTDFASIIWSFLVQHLVPALVEGNVYGWKPPRSGWESHGVLQQTSNSNRLWWILTKVMGVSHKIIQFLWISHDFIGIHTPLFTAAQLLSSWLSSGGPCGSRSHRSQSGCAPRQAQAGAGWKMMSHDAWKSMFIIVIVIVGGDWNMTFIFPSIGNVIIPIDFHIFQRGRYITNQVHTQTGHDICCRAQRTGHDCGVLFIDSYRSL